MHHAALAQAGVDLAVKGSLAPPSLGALPEIVFFGCVILDPGHDDEVVAPRDFSHQWCEFLSALVGVEVILATTPSLRATTDVFWAAGNAPAPTGCPIILKGKGHSCVSDWLALPRA